MKPITKAKVTEYIPLYLAENIIIEDSNTDTIFEMYDGSITIANTTSIFDNRLVYVLA